MSGSAGDAGSGAGANAAQTEFQRYKARMAEAAPMMMPVMMAPAMGPGWAMPPSLAAFGSAPHPMAGAGAPATGGSLGERLGTTLRLGVELLNTVLASSAGALGGAAAMLPEARYGDPCGCGCHRDCCCAYDCCTAMSYGCCQPGVFGCSR